MRSERMIRERLKKLLTDERLHYKAADVYINAPLALIQVGLETERDVLRWVLRDKRHT